MEDVTLQDVFFNPVRAAYEKSTHKRKSAVVSDFDFLEMGIKRVLIHNESGRSFVQLMIEKFNFVKLKVNNFFTALRSERRLSLTKEINENIVKDYISIDENDQFRNISELAKYAIYAADGHFHEHASHERHENGNHYPVGHIYFTNLRNNTMQHLDVLRPKNKKEHEIHALQRVGGKALRMGEPTGTKVLMVYDRAVIDFQEWYKWKKGHGLYVITREKSSMKLQPLGNLDFDRDNLINAGVISDQQVGHSHGRMIRKIVYKDPLSGIIYKFITNEMTLPPGVIAFIYKVRWDIEKVFQQFKSNFFEKKAWATSCEAKSIQATFLCIVHNLLLILENKLAEEEGIKDEKIIEKQKKRINERIEILIKANRVVNPMLLTLKKSVMRSCQFLRSVNIALDKLSSWRAFIVTVRPRMESYL